MMLWQKDQMEKLNQDLQGQPVKVWRSDPDWVEGDTIKRWKLIVEHMGKLTWMYTYNPQLTTLDTHVVQIYKDNSQYMRRCIRKPKEN